MWVKIKINTISNGRYVTATANSISEKGDVYETIINWIYSNKYKIIGNPFEQYNVNYQNGLFKIDIYYPVAVEYAKKWYVLKSISEFIDELLPQMNEVVSVLRRENYKWLQ